MANFVCDAPYETNHSVHLLVHHLVVNGIICGLAAVLYHTVQGEAGLRMVPGGLVMK